MAFSSLAHLWRWKGGDIHLQTGKGGGWEKDREITAEGRGRHKEWDHETRERAKGGCPFNHSFWLSGDNGQCLWMKITLQCNSDLFLLFFFFLPHFHSGGKREKESRDDEGSLLQINNSYKWASLIWVTIERLLICLVADESREGGGRGVGGSRRWEVHREGQMRKTLKCNCDWCFIPHMGSPFPPWLAVAVSLGVIVPSV